MAWYFPWGKKKQQQLGADGSFNLADVMQFFNGIQTTAGQPVNQQRAASLITVHRCIELRSTTLARLSLDVFRRVPGGKERVWSTDPLFNSLELRPFRRIPELLNEQPNDEQSSYAWREQGETAICMDGNYVNVLQQNNAGEYIGIIPIARSAFKSAERINGKLVYTLLDGTVIEDQDILHLKGWAFKSNEIWAPSPIALHREQLGWRLGQDEYSSKFFAKGMTAKGLIEIPFAPKSEEDAKKLRKTWEKVNEGSRNAHSIGWLLPGFKFVPLSMNHQDSQFIETMAMSDRQLCNIFGVPSHAINDTAVQTFASVQQKAKDFVNLTLGPIVKRWESEINRKLLKNARLPDGSHLFAQFDLFDYLDAEYTELSRVVQEEFKSELITKSEARKRLDYNAEAEDDEYYLPPNKVVQPQASTVIATPVVEQTPAEERTILTTPGLTQVSPLLRAAFGKTLTKECTQIKAAMKKNRGELQAFIAWMVDYYEDESASSISQKLASELAPIAECSQTPIDVARICESWVNQSRKQLMATIRESNAQTAWDNIHSCLDGWTERIEPAIARAQETTAVQTVETEKQVINISLKVEPQFQFEGELETVE